MSKKTIAILLLWMCVCQLTAQTTASVTQLTVNDGLSQGMVFDILQSRDGFMWIATKDGLNRYDGAGFKVFSPDPFDPYSIGDSEVRLLFEDSRGWIWVVLPDGLDVLDPLSGRFFHVKQAGKPVFSRWVKSIVETPDGAVWFSDDTRIWKINLQKDMLAKSIKLGNANIEPPCQTISMMEWSGKQLQAGHLIFTREKKLLVGTNHGLFQLDPATAQILPVLPIANWTTNFLAENADGEILAKGITPDAARNWVWITGSKVQFYKDPSPIIYSASRFMFDRAGFFWTFRDRSIQKWRVPAFLSGKNPELEIKEDPVFSNDRAYCTKFMFDQSGVVWVGTNGYGFFKINEKVPKFKIDLPKNSHRQLLEAPDGGFFSLEQPLIKYHAKTFDSPATHSDYYINIPPNLVTLGRLAVCFDLAGNGWSSFGLDSLLYRTDAVTKSRKSYPWKGVGLLLDRTGALLSVCETGLRKFDPQRETTSEFSFLKPQKRASEYSQFLYEDRDGIIWIFGFEGLTKAISTPSGYRFEYFTNNPTDRSSLSSNIVLSVADDPIEPGRYLWIGTKGGGLNRLDKKSGQFKQYKTVQGLPDNVVYGILAENPPSGAVTDRNQGFIWLSTNKGLCRFDVRAETTKNFTVADGLQENEFNSSSYLKLRDGAMVFGGVKGLTVFHPDSLRFNENIPQTRIVGLEVNNQQYNIAGKSSITLPYDQNLLTFDFAALEFTNPAQNQYRYQLVGVDKDWVALGTKNNIQFANLAPGTYTFKVLGSNNDGKWSEQPAEIHFTIRPPWWASRWAYAIYLALAATGVWQYYKYLLRQRFSEQEKLRLRELDDFKSRFFTNITHEFRTPLTVILGMSERVLNEGAAQSQPVAIAQPVALIKRSGENLLRLVNQILDLAKLESNTLKMNYIQGDILSFIRYIAESLHSLANAQNLLLRVESEQAKIVMDYDPERFLQIIYNLLSNAIKFTPSGGKVVLRADLEDKWLKISVTDSGAGIAPEELPHLFERFFQAKNQEHATSGGTGIGLSLTRELVKAMGGEISVDSKVGVGSTFFVRLPVTNNSVFEEDTTLVVGVTQRRHSDGVTPSHPVTMHPDTAQTILLIEDNPDVVAYLSACLKDQYALDFAYNGQAGIEKALENVPDLIVSDVMMPLKGGFEVVETLKNDERSSHIPIILLTAKADVQSRLAGLRRGADAYLSKPFHQEELLVTVENLLELRRTLQGRYQQSALSLAVPTSPVPADPEDSFLQKVRAMVEAHYPEEDFGVPQLCQKIGMSRSQLFRKMKALTDIAPSDLIRTHRLNKARALLESGAANVAEAAWQVGFKDPSYFSKLYQEEFGEAPSLTRK